MTTKRMIGVRIGKKIYVFKDPRPSKETFEAAKVMCITMGKAAIYVACYVGIVLVAAEIDQRL